MGYEERTVVYNGLKFVKDEHTGYYLNSTIRERLHRYVWIHNNGPIPAWYEVHHIDFNKDNNDIDNLSLMTHEAHRRLHADLLTHEQREARRHNMDATARPAACAWHGSDAGREWHRKHYAQMGAKMHQKITIKCDQCGKVVTVNHGSRFCSNNCKSAWRRAHHLDDVEFTCAMCGKKFMRNKYAVKDPSNVACSNACRSKLTWIKRRTNASL